MAFYPVRFSTVIASDSEAIQAYEARLDCFVASLLAMTGKLSLFWYGRPPAPSTALAAGQTLPFHAPDQEIDAVLAEERLVVEGEGRHAPMAGCGMRCFIVLDHGLVAVWVGRNRAVHRR